MLLGWWVRWLSILAKVLQCHGHDHCQADQAHRHTETEDDEKRSQFFVHASESSGLATGPVLTSHHRQSADPVPRFPVVLANQHRSPADPTARLPLGPLLRQAFPISDISPVPVLQRQRVAFSPSR